MEPEFLDQIAPDDDDPFCIYKCWNFGGNLPAHASRRKSKRRSAISFIDCVIKRAGVNSVDEDRPLVVVAHAPRLPLTPRWKECVYHRPPLGRDTGSSLGHVPTLVRCAVPVPMTRAPSVNGCRNLRKYTKFPTRRRRKI